MDVGLGTIFASIKLDTSGVTAGVQKAGQEISRFAGEVGKHADQVQSIGRRMGLAITGSLAGVRGQVGESVSVLTQGQQKIADSGERVTVDLTKMWTQIFVALRRGMSDTIADWIRGVRSFGDMWKQIWRQILVAMVNTLLQMTVFTQANIEKWTNAFSAFMDNFTLRIKGNIAEIAAQVYGLVNLLSGDKKRRRKGLLGGLLGIGLDYFTGGAFKPLGSFLTGAGIGGALFDNPINDTAAVRSGADFARLFRQGADAELGRYFPRAASVEPFGFAQGRRGAASVQDNRKYDVKVTTHVEKVMGIEDIERISETQAWIIGQKLNLVPSR